MQKAMIEGFRLSPQQTHLWQLLQGERDGVYEAQAVVSITGELDRARLRAALAELVAQHEILRTTFHRLPAMTIPQKKK